MMYLNGPFPISKFPGRVLGPHTPTLSAVLPSGESRISSHSAWGRGGHQLFLTRSFFLVAVSHGLIVLAFRLYFLISRDPLQHIWCNLLAFPLFQCFWSTPSSGNAAFSAVRGPKPALALSAEDCPAELQPFPPWHPGQEPPHPRLAHGSPSTFLPPEHASGSPCQHPPSPQPDAGAAPLSDSGPSSFSYDGFPSLFANILTFLIPGN